jgi:hypothetical protein
MVCQEVTAFLHCKGKTEKLLGAGLLEQSADLKWAKMNWMGWCRFMPRRDFLTR